MSALPCEVCSTPTNKHYLVRRTAARMRDNLCKLVVLALGDEVTTPRFGQAKLGKDRVGGSQRTPRYISRGRFPRGRND